MADLQIIDFSIQAQVDFKRPRLKTEADLTGIAQNINQNFGEFLGVQDVALVSTDDLFGYSLTIPMYNGAGDIVINPHNFSVGFRTGRNKEALKLIVESICKICEIVGKGEVRQAVITANVTAKFQEKAMYDEFMRRFVDAKKGVTAGGIVLFATGGSIKGDGRLGIEKALGFDDCLFISYAFSTAEAINVEWFNKLGERFLELVELQGIKLQLP